MSDDLKYAIALSLHPKIGARTFQKIQSRFNSFEQVWKSTPAKLQKNLPAEISNLIYEARSKFDPDSELKKIRKLGISVISLKDKKYPRLLSQIPDPPAVLYYKGEIEGLADEDFLISAVGTRMPTPYGIQVTLELVAALAQTGLGIVSGLALGIDSLAHKTALENNTKTVAVLGCGLDQVYPSSNRSLADKIIQKGGLILSEFPIGTPAFKFNFPIRNRIIAGLSRGTLVIEAAKNSGALITAWHALEYNRLVFSVPGSIYSDRSWGTNNLIKMGAKVVTQAFDILDELNLDGGKLKAKKEAQKLILDSPQEEMVLKYLSKEPVHLDKLAKESGLDISAVNSTLTLLEIKGYVRNLGGGNFVLN